MLHKNQICADIFSIFGCCILINELQIDIYPSAHERRKNMPGCQVRTILRSLPTLYRTDFIKGNNTANGAERQKSSKRNSGDVQRRRLASLAEAIIMQSLDDLWIKTQQSKSVAFFTGEGFDICATMAGMRVMDRIELFTLLRKLDYRMFGSRHAKKVRTAIKKIEPKAPDYMKLKKIG